MTGDIVAFLNARLSERQEAAEHAAVGRGKGHWNAEAEQPYRWGDQHRDRAVLGNGKPIAREDHEYSGGGVVEHIAMHDPSSVLADIAAKRTVLEACEDALVVVGGTGYGLALQVLRAQVGPFSAHPDFDPAWTVET